MQPYGVMLKIDAFYGHVAAPEPINVHLFNVHLFNVHLKNNASGASSICTKLPFFIFWSVEEIYRCQSIAFSVELCRMLVYSKFILVTYN